MGKSSASLAAGVAGRGWALPLLALGSPREQGSRRRSFTLSWEGPGMKEHSLTTPPHMPLCSGQNEFTGKGEGTPCSHGDEPGAHENCRLSPAWAPPPPPLFPLGSPEIGLGKRKWVVPWETSICILPLLYSLTPPPTKPGFGGLQHIKGIRGGEALRLADSASSLHYEWGN